MKRMLVWAIVAVAACAGNKASGPTALTTPDVGGAWNIAWSNLRATGVTCSASGGKITLTQSGTTFSGSYHSTLLQCNGTALGVAGGIVVNGSLRGSTIMFDMDPPNLHQHGTITDRSMSGSATWRIAADGTSSTLTGTWAAVR